MNNWKTIRPIHAGLYARASYPENKPFYVTNAFLLDEPVSGEAVKLAWDKTIQVYPFMSRAVVKRDKVYYLAENPLDFVIRETDEIIAPASPEGNYHAVTICYSGRRLAFYYDHVMSDGTAFRMILDTFFYYYYCTVDHVSYPVSDGVRTLEDGVASDIEEDAFLKAGNPGQEKRKEQEKKEQDKNEQAGGQTSHIASGVKHFCYPEAPKLQVPGEISLSGCGHYIIRVPSEEFMAYAHSVGGSPSSVLAQLVCQSLERMNPGNMLPFGTVTPVSVRKKMGNTGSLLNQVVHMFCRIDPKTLSDENAVLFHQNFRSRLKKAGSKEEIMRMSVRYNDTIEMYKQAIASDTLDQVSPLQSRSAGVILLSYLGKLADAPYGSRIKLECYRAMPDAGIRVYLYEIGDAFHFSFNIGTKTDRYARDMAQHMKELGMAHAQFESVD